MSRRSAERISRHIRPQNNDTQYRCSTIKMTGTTDKLLISAMLTCRLSNQASCCTQCVAVCKCIQTACMRCWTWAKTLRKRCRTLTPGFSRSADIVRTQFPQLSQSFRLRLCHAAQSRSNSVEAGSLLFGFAVQASSSFQQVFHQRFLLFWAPHLLHFYFEQTVQKAKPMQRNA